MASAATTADSAPKPPPVPPSSGAGGGAGATEGQSVPAAAHGVSGKDVVVVTAEVTAQHVADQGKKHQTPTPLTMDDHPFLHYYGMLAHQQNMLQDAVRTGTYQNAMFSNKADFKNKVVLDVGTGTGILAYFAVQAGAKRVYGVEASGMAHHAARLMRANYLADKVIIINGKVEDVKLGEKVDMIISEPMGFVLVHERMLESYVRARKMFLKPGGKMFPSVGSIYCCPFTDEALYQEQVGKVGFWNSTNFYGLDLTCLAPMGKSDHFSQPVVGYFDPAILLSADIAEHKIDFGTIEPEDLHEFTIPIKATITRTALLHGIACWFDVSFNGSQASVPLSTGPSDSGTHWYQCRLLLKEPIGVNATQVVTGKLHFVANKQFSYYITMTVNLEGTSISATNVINLHDQMYHYLSNAEAATSSSGVTHGW